MPYSDILYDKRDAVATITLNRPQVMNACTVKTYAEITDALRDAENDSAVRVVVISGAGRGFCAGDDVREIFLNPDVQNARPSRSVEVEQWRRHEPVALDFLITYPKPTIASVNGAAVGYGCDIALMCDMRICSDQARFGEVFIRRGLIPEAGGLLVLPRLVGLARAYELFLSGDIISASEAERIGMVNKVVPHEKLAEATAEFAGKFKAQAPLAQRLAKEALRIGLNLNLAYFFDYQRQGQHLMLTSKDHLEGARSFIEKRSPNFKGE